MRGWQIFSASVILAMHAAAGTCTASYEVGFDFNYRSDDAIFPKILLTSVTRRGMEAERRKGGMSS